MGYFFFQHLLPNIKDFCVIFEDLLTISSFSKFKGIKSFFKKSVLIPIPKCGLGFGPQYRTLILVVNYLNYFLNLIHLIPFWSNRVCRAPVYIITGKQTTGIRAYCSNVYTVFSRSYLIFHQTSNPLKLNQVSLL